MEPGLSHPAFSILGLGCGLSSAFLTKPPLCRQLSVILLQGVWPAMNNSTPDLTHSPPKQGGDLAAPVPTLGPLAWTFPFMRLSSPDFSPLNLLSMCAPKRLFITWGLSRKLLGHPKWVNSRRVYYKSVHIGTSLSQYFCGPRQEYKLDPPGAPPLSPPA